VIAPQIDGSIREGSWNQFTRLTKPFEFGRLVSEELYKLHLPATILHLTHDNKNLYVAMRCRTDASTQGEWVAVDLAPLNATERWRFVLTQKGTRVVERHTREGQFRVEGVNWSSAQQRFNGYYDVEMQIPLSVVGNATKFRFNALRRTTHAATGTRVVMRAWPDAGDVYLMRIATLSSDGLKSKAETKQPTAARVLDKPATNKTQR
jgi:hypothetical protein